MLSGVPSSPLGETSEVICLVRDQLCYSPATTLSTIFEASAPFKFFKHASSLVSSGPNFPYEDIVIQKKLALRISLCLLPMICLSSCNPASSPASAVQLGGFLVGLQQVKTMLSETLGTTD